MGGSNNHHEIHSSTTNNNNNNTNVVATTIMFVQCEKISKPYYNNSMASILLLEFLFTNLPLTPHRIGIVVKRLL
jgi:hypothetical protein